jgi:branched-chain amino acid aminotransferase
MNINNDKTEKYFLYNNNLVSSIQNIDPIPDTVGVLYEVIRVIDGTPLFLEPHIERLMKSMALSGISCIDSDEIYKGIKMLLKSNYVKEKNLKITFFCTENSNPNFYAYFVESQYPNQMAYKYGVKVELLPMERNNPNVKLENPKLRGSADKVLCLSQTHEALLVNEQGFITEGSRSNFFAIFGNSVVTPPATAVLEGITRKMIIQLAIDNSIQIIERPIHTSEVENMDGAFITGTSSKVLPIAKVGDFSFKEIPSLTLQLLDLYDKLVDKSLQEYKI